MANGDISGIIDSLEYSTANYPNQIAKSHLSRVSGDTYITSLSAGFVGPAEYSGSMYTFDIASDGTIGSVIDAWGYSSVDTKGYSPVSIIVPDTNYHLMVRSDAAFDGYATTNTIADNGTITKSFASSTKIFEYSECPSMCHMYTSGTKEYYVVVTSGEYSAAPTNHGAIALISVDITDGTVTSEDGAEFDATYCYMPQCVRIADGVVGIYYKTTSTATKLLSVVTYAIDTGAHSIGASIDSLQITSTAKGSAARTYNMITHLVGNIYVCSWMDEVDDGHITTISIDSAGAIGATVEDTFEFQTTSAEFMDIVRVRDDVIGIVATAGTGNVDLATYEIAADGTINTTRLDIQTIASAESTGFFNRLNYIQDSGDVWAVTRSVPNATFLGGAWVYTVTIEGTDPLTQAAAFTSDSVIHVTETGTFTSDSHISTTETATFNSDSHISTAETETFTSDARIGEGAEEETGNLNSDAKIIARYKPRILLQYEYNTGRGGGFEGGGNGGTT